LLLLRGPQTPGELKGRTDRWHRFRSLEDVEAVLDRMATRELAVQLPRRPGQKEARWAQLLAADGSAPSSEAPAAPPVQRDPVPPPPAPAASVPPVPAAPAAAPHSLEIRSPADGELIRTVAVTEPSEIGQKVRRARAAQAGWAGRGFDPRAQALREFRRLLDAEAEECAHLTTQEMGKPIRQSRAEVRAVLERIDWNVEHVGSVIEPRTIADGDPVERVTYEALGVVAHISAWNYPYFVALNSIVPALLTGNAVVYKPSEHATLTGLRIVDMMHRSGVPVDVVQTVVGAGPTGATLVESDVDMVCFTGSHATGQRVLRAAAERMIRVQLELGGKDAAYVCDDVDVDGAAIDVAEGAFYNAGQSCSATERVYVHEAIWDRFVEAFVQVATGYRVGPPDEDATDLGPLARDAQRDLLDTQLGDATQRGARVLVGGHRRDGPGNFYEPTVVVDVDDTMALMRDESFGPVIGLARVAGDADAIARMDDTEFGLGAAVFTRDRVRAESILGRLDVGNAYWNTADRSTVRLPWAGRRHSGLGVSMSEAGVRSFVREKSWHLFPAAPPQT
jgi:acyl-CoA reductase-like NAD-dependent aldehyde dehydrogenase